MKPRKSCILVKYFTIELYSHGTLMVAIISSLRCLRTLIPYLKSCFGSVYSHFLKLSSIHLYSPLETIHCLLQLRIKLAVSYTLSLLGGALWETESFLKLLSFVKFYQEIDVFLPQPSLYYIAQNRYLLFLWLFFASPFHFL